MTATAAPARTGDRVGWVIGAGFTVVIAALSWLRHRNGWSGGLDLGIFDQGVWLLSEGRSPEVSLNGHNLFADHLSPVLLLFVPLYWLHATPVWLLVGQAVSLGAGVVGIRRFALDRSVPALPATIAAVVSAPLLAGAVFDSHPSTMAVGPLCWLLVYLGRDRSGPVIALAIAVLVCRADLGWIVACLAIVAPPRQRRNLVVIGLTGFVLGMVIPSLFGEPSTFPVHYGQLGSSPKDAALHPYRLLTAFSAADLRTYFLWLLAGGLLCLRTPRWAITVALAGLPVLLSQWGGTESPYFHYGAPIAPIVLAGSIVALGEGRRGAEGWHLVAGALVATLLAGPLSPKAPAALSYVDILQPRVGDQLAEALAAVGPDEPVAAVNRVVPHLSERVAIYGFPIPFRTTELSVLYGDGDPEAADAIRVIIIDDDYREEAEALGFELEDLGDLLIGRR